MYNLKEKFYSSKALFSAIAFCMSFFFSAHSFATSDTYAAMSGSIISAEQNDIQPGVDGDDSFDPPLHAQFTLKLAAFREQAVISSNYYIPGQHNHSISVRAPPYLNLYT